MLEEHVAYYLEKYLGNYVKGLSKEALKISVWQGTGFSHSVSLLLLSSPLLSPNTQNENFFLSPPHPKLSFEFISLFQMWVFVVYPIQQDPPTPITPHHPLSSLIIHPPVL
jgi:hypothetical protein